jgi:cold shock protein
VEFSEQAITTGVVKFFDATKNFGIVTADDGSEYFLGGKELSRTGVGDLQEGQRLTFSTRPDDHGRTARAINVRILGGADG